jgi:D-alanyl-D-alanine carboxypeptidase
MSRSLDDSIRRSGALRGFRRRRLARIGHDPRFIERGSSGMTRRLAHAVSAMARAAARPLALAGAFFCAAALGGQAHATPSLVVDEDTGAVLQATDATEPWYPASLTKLMTAYVVLDQIRAGKLSPDSLVVVTPLAARQAPSKMGFKPGTVLTVDNALKMMLVKSANDIAMAIGESLGGSVEGFAAMMNQDAQRLGMKDSHFENPNGLPDPDHYSSAQDLAILARALLKEFPQYRGYFGIGAISLDGRVYHTYNNLFGRYDGVDGMKTGFICAAGFNTVVTATRNGRHLIAVVLGQPSATTRAVVTADLLDKAFLAHNWASGPNVASLARVGGSPPDMHAQICGRHRKRGAVTWETEVDPSAPCIGPGGASGTNPALETLVGQNGASCGDTSGKTASPRTPVAFDPIPVFVGPSAGSANAPEPPGTLATLKASPAMAGKQGTGVPADAAAYATTGGAQEDALPHAVGRGAHPVRLHGEVETKTPARRTLHGRRGAATAVRTPAEHGRSAAKGHKARPAKASKHHVDKRGAAAHGHVKASRKRPKSASASR